MWIEGRPSLRLSVSGSHRPEDNTSVSFLFYSELSRSKLSSVDSDVQSIFLQERSEFTVKHWYTKLLKKTLRIFTSLNASVDFHCKYNYKINMNLVVLGENIFWLYFTARHTFK